MESTEPSQLFDAWAIIELFGHQRIAGRVSEQTIGGGNMIRVDVPAVGKAPAFTRFYGAAAIYSITPTSEEVAKVVAQSIRAAPITIYLPDLPQLPERSQGWDDDS